MSKKEKKKSERKRELLQINIVKYRHFESVKETQLAKLKTATATTKNINTTRIRIRITIYQFYRRHQRQWDIIRRCSRLALNSFCILVRSLSFIHSWAIFLSYETYIKFCVFCVFEWLNCTRMSNNELNAWAMIIALQTQQANQIHSPCGASWFSWNLQQISAPTVKSADHSTEKRTK